jgi:HSP20 family molecular chaperone IbpA
MNALQRYHSANLPELLERIQKNGIGMDDYLDRFFNSDYPQSNYPPYNLIELNNHESRLEIALAGFKKDQLRVFTEFGKLSVEGTKEESENNGSFVHKGLAQRSFKRVWTVSDDTKVGSVKFEDGLLSIELKKIVPDHHARKDYLGGSDHETN